MSSFKVRTDLALEARESIDDNAQECRGVSVEEEYREESEIKITKVVIETKNGAKAMGKPIGTYITLEAPAMALPDENYHKEISDELAAQLCEIIPDMERELSIMVVGLGNRDVTADALGQMMRQSGEEPLEIKDELLSSLGELYNMYVTGKDVDYEIRQISHIICNALNSALEV